MTLVEMLAAMAITLIMILALANIFKIVGDEVRRSRAVMEVSGQMRQVANRLQDDLDGLTVPARPWPTPAWGLGYLEYGEGPSPFNPAGVALMFDAHPSVVNTDSRVGDFDDYLALTARAVREPFRGRVDNAILVAAGLLPAGAPAGFTIIESELAEILWWMQLEDENSNARWDAGETFTLRRRVLLIRPDLNSIATGTVPNAQPNLVAFLNQNDLSVHVTPANTTVANSLADLTRRENRVAHVPTAASFPNLFDYTRVPLNSGVAAEGEDVILAHVTSFDIKVFDPRAAIRVSGVEGVLPGDPAYAGLTTSNPPAGLGAFVDLNYSSMFGTGANSLFSGAPHTKSGLAAQPTYDTWSLDYEYDGLNQGGIGAADDASNGVDDDGTAGVDDPGERDTSPPYPFPLRGLQASLRVYDRDTRLVRQVSVVADFTPE